MAMFHDGNRTLQDRYKGRAVADKIVELVETSPFNDDFKAFVEAAPFFFQATSAGDNTDCSFKGGAPAFVRVPAHSGSQHGTANTRLEKRATNRRTARQRVSATCVT
mgnify:CR=1 FL=1